MATREELLIRRRELLLQRRNLLLQQEQGATPALTSGAGRGAGVNAAPAPVALPPPPNAIDQINAIFEAGGAPAQSGSAQAGPGALTTPQQAADQVAAEFQRTRGRANPSLNRNIAVTPQAESERTGIGAELSQVPGVQAVQALGRAATGPTAQGIAGETTGRIAGATIGGAVAGPPGAAVGGIAGGMVGAAGTLLLQRLISGDDVTGSDIAIEAGFSALPDIGAGALRAGQRALSRTSTGIRTAERAGAERIQQRTAEVFKAPEEEAVKNLFEMARQSGDKIGPTQLVPRMQAFSTEQFNDVTNMISRISAPPGKEADDFGRKAAKFFQALREDKITTGGIDLGWLQHIQSQLRKRLDGDKGVARLGDGPIRDAVTTFRNDIDDVLLNGRLTTGSTGEGRAFLQEGRRQFRKQEQVKEFGNFMRRSLTPRSKTNNSRGLNLRKLADTIADPKGKEELQVTQIFKENPALKNEMVTFLRNMDRVNLEPGLIAKISSPGLAVVGGGTLGAIGAGSGVTDERTSFLPVAVILSSLMLAGPASRARFNRLVRENDNTVTFPMMRVLLNQARRDLLSGGDPLNQNQPTLAASPL